MHQGKIGLAFVSESVYQAYFDVPEGRSCRVQIVSQFCVFSVREWVRVMDRGKLWKFQVSLRQVRWQARCQQRRRSKRYGSL